MQNLLLNLGLRRNDKSKEEDIYFENINLTIFSDILVKNQVTSNTE